MSFWAVAISVRHVNDIKHNSASEGVVKLKSANMEVCGRKHQKWHLRSVARLSISCNIHEQTVNILNINSVTSNSRTNPHNRHSRLYFQNGRWRSLRSTLIHPRILNIKIYFPKNAVIIFFWEIKLKQHNCQNISAVYLATHYTKTAKHEPQKKIECSLLDYPIYHTKWNTSDMWNCMPHNIRSSTSG